MRFLYAILAGILWIVFVVYITSKGAPNPSNNIQMLSLAIVIAGALAGGD